MLHMSLSVSSMYRTLAVAILCMAAIELCCASTSAPVGDYATPVMWPVPEDGGQKRLNNFCSRATALINGSIAYVDALQGANVSAVFIDFEGWLDYDSTVTATAPYGTAVNGFIYELLQMAADLGGFNLQVAVGGGPNKAAGETFTTWMVNRTKTYDIVAEWFIDTAARRALGATYPYNFIDVSLMIVARKIKAIEPSLVTKLFSFLTPFQRDVWLLILGAIIFTALVFWWMEGKKNKDDFKAKPYTTSRDIGRSIFLAAASFTGGGGYTPKTPFGRLFVVSWTFLLLLLVSAYTANLATFLITSAEKTSAVKDIDDMVFRKIPTCVEKGTAMESILKSSYPSLPVIAKDSGTDMADGLRLPEGTEGSCTAAVMAISDWEQRYVSEDFNPSEECDMEFISRPFEKLGGGFIVGSDSQIECTSLVSTTLGFLLRELETSGKVAELWQKLIDRKTTNDCAVKEASGGEEDDGSDPALGVDNMGGAFLVHGVLSVVCIIGDALYTKFYMPCKRARRPKKAKKAPDVTAAEVKEIVAEQLMEVEKRQSEILNLLRGLHETNGSKPDRFAVGGSSQAPVAAMGALPVPLPNPAAYRGAPAPAGTADDYDLPPSSGPHHVSLGLVSPSNPVNPETADITGSPRPFVLL